MERFISRDPFESDKRVETNWWLKEEPCDYCMSKNSDACEKCVYKKQRIIYNIH